MSRNFWQKIFERAGVVGGILFWLAAGAARASGETLKLNEIYPSPASGEVEWLEIYNSSQETLSLRGWQVMDASQKQEFLIKTDQEATVAAAGFFVLETSTVSLNNDGDTIYLISPTGVQVDSVTTPSLRQKSYARNVDGAGSWATTAQITKGSSNNSPQISTADTVKTENLTTVNDDNEETAVPSLAGLELYPCPNSGEKEWLRLQNTGTAAINLLGFKLKNHNGYARNLTDVIIEAGSSVKIEFTSGLAVNSGGNLFLLDPAGETLLEINYASCSSKGVTFASINGTWTEKITTTKTDDEDSVTDTEKKAQNSSASKTTDTADKLVSQTDLAAASWTEGKKFAAPKTNYQTANVGAVLGAHTQEATLSGGSATANASQGQNRFLFLFFAIAVIMVGSLLLIVVGWQWWQEKQIASNAKDNAHKTENLVEY